MKETKIEWDDLGFLTSRELWGFLAKLKIPYCNIEDEEKVLVVAADITSKAIRDQINDGKLTAVEGLLASIEAADSTSAVLITPNLKDIKLFTEAVIKTAEDGNMCHMKDYVHETGNNIPQEIWDYIYKLTNGK